MKLAKTILINCFLLAGITLQAKTIHSDPTPVEPEDIYGSVTHAGKDKPLKDVVITAFLQSKKEKITISNIDGEYAIDDLPPGTYKLVFEKEGYRKVIKEKVIIKPNSGLELNIEMEQKAYDLSPSPFHFLEF